MRSFSFNFKLKVVTIIPNIGERETALVTGVCPSPIDCFFAPPRRKRFIFFPPSERRTSRRPQSQKMKTARAHPFHSPSSNGVSLRRTPLGQLGRQGGHARAHPDGNPDDRARHDTPHRRRRQQQRKPAYPADGRTSVSHGADFLESGRVEQFRKRTQLATILQEDLQMTMPIEDITQ